MFAALLRKLSRSDSAAGLFGMCGMKEERGAQRRACFTYDMTPDHIIPSRDRLARIAGNDIFHLGLERRFGFAQHVQELDRRDSYHNKR